jgi:AraC family transcriptional regulator
MTGFELIVEALELFEKSLSGNDSRGSIRTVTELARRTGYSLYHFTRLFCAVTGVPPKEYISGRILTEAGRKIADTSAPIVTIAAAAGFEDYATFSRAFKKRFGVPPKMIRERRAMPAFVVEHMMPRRSAGALRLTSAEPEAVDMQSRCLCGLPFFIEPETRSFHKQWATFMAAQARVRGRIMPEVFYQFSSWMDDEPVAGLTILCALETDREVVQEPFFTTRILPEASCLRFVHTGDLSTLSDTYAYIYGEWLASHDAKPAGQWEFQRCQDGGRTTEIYIPVALASTC